VENVESFTLDLKSTEPEVDRALSRLRATAFDAVVFSIAVRARSGKGSAALPKAGVTIAHRLIASQAPLLVISFGNPYLLGAMPQSPSYLLAYNLFPVSQRAAARALVGETDLNGKLPVSLPGLYPRSHGLSVARR
jgi:beta-N-acetylhexosaminidase